MSELPNTIRDRLPFFWRSTVAPIALIAAVFTAYSGVFGYPFFYDDEFLIQKNRFLDSFSNIGAIFRSSSTAGAGFLDSFYRPMQILCYLLVKQIFGGESWGFHLLNVTVHSLNTVLIYVFARRLAISRPFAFCGALVWALHPMHTEAVTYASATGDVLYVFFILAALLVAMPPKVSSWRLVAGAALFAFGLLSKESAIVFPALLFATIFLTSERRFTWRPYLRTVPFFLIALGYLLLRKTVLDFNGDFSFYKTENIYTSSVLIRFWTFLATLPSYVALIVWPHDLHMDRAFPVYTSPDALAVELGSIIMLIAAAAALWPVLRYWKRRELRGLPWAAWAVLWMAAAHAPQSGVLLPVNSFFLEHWMYLPSIALVLLAGAWCDVLLVGRRSIAVACTVFAVTAAALGGATFEQNKVWSSPIVFFSNILKYNPKADRVRHNLAMAYSDEGLLDQALKEYQTVLDHTDRYPQTYHNIARIYFKQKRYDLAEANFQKALGILPRFYPSYLGLAELYLTEGKIERARQAKQRADDIVAGRPVIPLDGSH